MFWTRHWEPSKAVPPDAGPAEKVKLQVYENKNWNEKIINIIDVIYENTLL